MAGPGRARKIAVLGGGGSLKYTPWYSDDWELWAHASCRMKCAREPDVFFDLHPKELWSNPTLKFWDTTYLQWLAWNHQPIYMQAVFPEAPSSIRYPFETVVTEFPRGYMTNTLSYMVALALVEGVTHLGVFGCDYASGSEYGPQRGCAEYWLGVAEGRGVHVLIPPTCDLLNRPSLLYGYESHPGGKRDPSYLFRVGCDPGETAKPSGEATHPSGKPIELIPADSPDAPPLRNIGVPPAPREN
jgi:hypothetical protein